MMQPGNHAIGISLDTALLAYHSLFNIFLKDPMAKFMHTKWEKEGIAGLNACPNILNVPAAFYL